MPLTSSTLGKRRQFERPDDHTAHGAPEEQVLNGRRKKQRISTAEYDTDSSDAQESDTDTRTMKQESVVQVDDDEDDMFAVDEEDGDAPVKGKSSTSNQHDQLLDYEQFNEKYLEEGEIAPTEGLSDDSSGEVRVEAFNIEEEKKLGYFDKEGNYVETQRDEDDAIQDQDLWIDDAKNVEEVAAAKKLADASNSNRLRQAQETTRHYMTDEALFRVKYLLSKEDTVMETMVKLNELRKASKSSKGFIVNSINLLSDLVTILERKGIEDVYSLRRAEVEKLLKEESLNASELNDDYKSRIWNFIWFEKPLIVHGPYTNYQMQYWKQSYFQNSVAVRLQDEPDRPENWLHIDTVTFM